MLALQHLLTTNALDSIHLVSDGELPYDNTLVYPLTDPHPLSVTVRGQ